VNALRTLVFRIVFYGLSVPIVGTAPLSGLFGRRAMIAHARVWARFHRWATRAMLGIGVAVEGRVPAGPVLYAVKHQAMFETVEMVAIDAPAVVLKRELTRIPFWGWATAVYGRVVVDREGAASALRAMLRQARALAAEGRSVMIFPEGTRVAPGERPPLKSGFAGLYKALGLPVVPVAVDSGQVWPRRGSKRPGLVTFRFGEPIPPGLPRAEVEARVHAEINSLEGERAGPDAGGTAADPAPHVAG